jgi:DNA-binding IclR family transcriptional regulator
MPARSRRDYFKEQGLRPFTGNTLTDEDTINHELALSARSGLFTEQEQYRQEVCCAAVVVGGGQGTIGVSVPAESWSRVSAALGRQLCVRAGDLV